MYNQNNTALMENEKFVLPAMAEGEREFTAEELAEDRDGLAMNFQRVKILTGVVLYNHATCAYWPEGDEYDDNVSPLCSSVDGKQGIGTPGGLCSCCVLNTFGSASDGKSKACKNMRVLYLLRSGEYMPLQLTLPPTSIKPWGSFLNQSFLARQRATYGSVIQVGLKKMNNGANDYSVATFRRLYDFSGEELAQIRVHANNFREQIKLILQQRAAMNEEQKKPVQLSLFDMM